MTENSVNNLTLQMWAARQYLGKLAVREPPQMDPFYCKMVRQCVDLELGSCAPTPALPFTGSETSDEWLAPRIHIGGGASSCLPGLLQRSQHQGR